MQKNEIFERIKAAKEALKQNNPNAASNITVVKSDTAKQYEKTVRNLFGIDPVTGMLITPSEPKQVVKTIHEKAKTIATLRKYATSVRYAAMIGLKELLKRADTAQRAGEWDVVEHIVSLDIFHVYTVLTEMMVKDYREGWMPERKRKSKKTSLANLPLDWREKIAREVHGQFRVPALVALLTGCRPSEVGKGILIERINGSIYATIKSAKHTLVAGQEQRKFKMADHSITKTLIKAMDELDEHTNVLIVKVEHGNSLTTHLRKVAKKLWPWLKESITVYSARHAMAADCKKAIQNGADEDLVSEVLGHVVDKTASYYGAASQCGTNSVSPTEVVVSKKIKHKVKLRNKERSIKRGLQKNRLLIKIIT